MPKRWSKLRKQVEDLFVEKISLHIQCSEIRTTPSNDGSLVNVLGIFSVRLGKETIWDFPKQFVDYYTVHPDGGNQYSYGVNDINNVLRDYLDTPKEVLLSKIFDRDFYGITNILKAADRRIGIKKLQDHFKSSECDFVQKVLAARVALQ